MAARREWSTLIAVMVGSSACSEPPTPSITIAEPTAGEMVVTTPEVSGTEPEVEIEVAFDVHDFALKEPGTCDGAAACGHVHIHVDGDTCNDSDATGKLDYNEEVFASPSDADLIYCKDVTIGTTGVMGLDGEHVVTLSLVGDDEEPVKGADGRAIEAQVNVTVHVEQPTGAGGG